MAASGETRAAGAPRRSLSTMAKPLSPMAGSSSASTRSTVASGRRVGAQAHQQRVDRPRVALGLEQHPALVVQHPPGQAELGRHAVDEGPEPDPLHGALDARPHAPPGAGDGPQRLRAGAQDP